MLSQRLYRRKLLILVLRSIGPFVIVAIACVDDSKVFIDRRLGYFFGSSRSFIGRRIGGFGSLLLVLKYGLDAITSGSTSLLRFPLASSFCSVGRLITVLLQEIGPEIFVYRRCWSQYGAVLSGLVDLPYSGIGEGAFRLAVLVTSIVMRFVFIPAKRAGHDDRRL